MGSGAGVNGSGGGGGGGGGGGNRVSATLASVCVVLLASLSLLFLSQQASLMVHAAEEDCIVECASPNRTQQTEPLGRKKHPFAVAQFPSPHSEFCELGCRLFFVRNNTVKGCSSQCSTFYRYNVTVGYSDIAEVAEAECIDGCNIAVATCQGGYYCLNDTQTMIPCPAGTYREDDVTSVGACIPCPAGRFRGTEKAKSEDDCEKCPQGTYANVTGSRSETDCIRCPAGKYGPESGMALCKCITEDSCGEYEDFNGRSIPYVGRW